MDVSEVYLELFGRIPPLVRTSVEGLDPQALTQAPEPGTNPVGWLVWHLTRVQDFHVSELLDEPQLWMVDEWPGRFGLTPEPWNLGFGHQRADIASVQPESAEALVEYFDAVYARTRPILEGLTPESLSEVVDERWDPPVTLGVRLVSIADDSLQHVGQAAYVRGLVQQGWHIGY
ncbi:MAG: DUF664 domain-containing protein [Candidatus Nanopelagicales bacterium]